jgi:RecA-family ATPase
VTDLLPAPRTFRLTRLADVTPSPITWLWPGRIPYGSLTVLSGDPGLGKSQMTLRIAAELTAGGTDVILVGAEDALEDTVRPRVVAAGGDLTRIHSFDPQEAYGTDLTSLPEDVPLLRRAVKDVGASLVIVDPIAAYLSEDLNANSDHSLRRATGPLAQMSRETGCATVLVSHLRKGREGPALYRVGGSIGLTGAARSVLFFGKPKRKKSEDATWAAWDADERWVTHVKANGARLAPALQAFIHSKTVQDAGLSIDTSYVEFGREDEDVYPEDLD